MLTSQPIGRGLQLPLSLSSCLEWVRLHCIGIGELGVSF